MKNLVFLIFLMFCTLWIPAQNLFLEECFVGGVTVAGRTSISFIDGHTKIKWEEGYTLKSAYVLTYRYGRPQPKPFTVNEVDLEWDYIHQIGAEQPDRAGRDYFAVHVQDISDKIVVENDSLSLYMYAYDPISGNLNQGWWSLDFVILYTSPSMEDTTCIRLYTASQLQTETQIYWFEPPEYKVSTDIGFAIYSDRVGAALFGNPFGDHTRITVNDSVLGYIWGADAINPHASGVRGHFYYEEGALHGLDDDTANTRVYRSDGIAVINGYLNSQNTQKLGLSHNPIWGANPHPAFFITYTPSCTVPESAVERSAVFCRGDTVQLSAQGYDHYAWTPAVGLSDSTLANPLCFADSSRWYRVRMWSDDETVCPQTIPVFVDVQDVPRPESLEVSPSACPAHTGRVTAVNTPGKGPLTYTLNGKTNQNGDFALLPPGDYHLSIATALGCTWDTTLAVPRKTLQTAAFTPNPESGYSPLQVFFENQSTGATSYQWLIDGVPMRNNQNFRHTFHEPGEYEVTLLAFYMDSTCADTARYTLVVWPGLEVVLPNIITPNNDGKNDALVAILAGVAHIRWEVFNRWGNKLYGGEASSPGESLELWSPEPDVHPAGTYTVVVTAQGDNGQVKDFVVQVAVKG